MSANPARSYSPAQYANNVTPFPVQKRVVRTAELPPTRTDKVAVLAVLAFVVGLLALFTIVELRGSPRVGPGRERFLRPVSAARDVARKKT